MFSDKGQFEDCGNSGRGVEIGKDYIKEELAKQCEPPGVASK